MHHRRCRAGARWAAAVTLVAGCLWYARGETPLASKTIALVGGRVVTQTNAGTVPGTVLVRDGVIAAVGANVEVPSDAARIDVSGCIVTPGLIDARSSLWLAGTASRDSASDGGLDVLDGIDPHEDDWKEVVRQGVTAVYVQPSGLLGGRGAVLRVAPAEGLDDLILKPAAALQASLSATQPTPQTQAPPQNFSRRGGPQPAAAPAQPAPPANNSLTRHAQYEQLKRTFDAAKQYDEAWKKAEKSKSAKGPSGVKRDPAKDYLRKVLSGEVPLRLEAQREDDVRNALRLADEFKIRVILDGVNNPRAAAEAVLNRRLPLVLGPFAETDEALSRRERSANWPKALLASDSRWALGTFSTQPRGSRLLRVHAAAAVARGVEPDSVLRAMTRNAADILGVGDRLGTIAAGKQADLAVFAGDPLDPSVPARLVISKGVIVYEGSTGAQTAIGTQNSRTKPKLVLPTKLPKQYVLKTGRLCLEDGQPRPGMVFVDNGKIAAIGESVSASAGVPTYDLGSAVLTAGLVVGHSQLGLGGAIDDPAEADAGHVSAADVYDPQQRLVRDLLAAGFTGAVFAPGSANVVAGGACGVRLGAPGPVGGDAGLKFVLTSSSRDTSRTGTDNSDSPVSFQGRTRGPARYPGSLAGQVELIEHVLSGQSPPSELYLPGRVRHEVEKERRQRAAAVLERKQAALFEAHTRAEVDAALQLIDRFKLRAVLVYPDEIKPFLPELKRLGVGVVAAPIHANDYDRVAVELAEAAAAGVPVAFGAASAHEARLTAALAVNAGMPRDVAWRGLTTAAGQLVGLPNTCGRLVVDGPADWVVWDGPPLDLRSRPLRVAVAGQLTSAAK